MQLPSDSSSTLIVAGVHSYTPGQFLTAAPEPGAPDGFLLKVVSSSIVGGDTEVQTEPGSLYEAVPNGEIDSGLGNLGSAHAMNADARRISKAIRNAAPGDPNADVPFDQKVKCKGTAELSLTGSLKTSLAPHLSIKWHKHFGIPFGVDKAKATLDASVEAEAHGEVSGKDECNLGPINLFEPEWETVVEVGAVPVPVTVKIPIDLSGSATVEGSISVKATAEAHGSLGVVYEHGELAGIHELSTEANLEEPTTKVVDTLEATIGPNVMVTAGWQVKHLGGVAATVGVEATTGLKLTYEPLVSPPGTLCVPFKISGSVSLELPFDTIEKSEPLYQGNIKCIHWGGGPGLHWKGTITYSDHDHWANWNGLGETQDQTSTASWQVDAHTAEGYGDGHELEYSDSSWHSKFEETSIRECTTQNLEYRHLREGSGSGPPNDEGINGGQGRLGEELQVNFWPDGYSFGLGTPYGEFSDSSTNVDCEGHSESSSNYPGFNMNYTGICGASSESTPIPRTGTEVVAQLSGEGLCTNQSVETSWTLNLDLTVTCPGGVAPDAEWMCPEP